MNIRPIKKKLKLFGFNNLTKTLSFNIYDICYAKTPEDKKAYIEYIDEEYNSERLTNILVKVADIIGANVLNIANQDYSPQGASGTVLISEEKLLEPDKEDVVIHLDKSHLTVHTYPESHPDQGISTFRADIDVSTCGKISPLRALNFLIESFDSDIIYLDYRIRGFTREQNGKKLFLDHKINSIQNFIDKNILDQYHAVDVNIYQENIFHTKMLLKHFDLDNYLFGIEKNKLPSNEKKKIKRKLKKEMQEIFYGQNIPDLPKLKIKDKNPSSE